DGILLVGCRLLLDQVVVVLDHRLLSGIDPGLLGGRCRRQAPRRGQQQGKRWRANTHRHLLAAGRQQSLRQMRGKTEAATGRRRATGGQFAWFSSSSPVRVTTCTRLVAPEIPN